LSKTIVTKLVLAVLLIGAFSFGANVLRVRASPTTWIVDDDGPADFQGIQEAINAANQGDTIFVLSGTYYENIVLNKSVAIIGESKETTIIDGSETGTVVYVNHHNIQISRFTIQRSGTQAFDSGIFLSRTENITVDTNSIINNRDGIRTQTPGSVVLKENVLTNNTIGIEIVYSSNVRVQSNRVVNSAHYGISLWHSNVSTVTENTVINDGYNGIRVASSNCNIISQNIIANNNQGIRLGNAHGNTIYHNAVSNNTMQVVLDEPFNNEWDDGYPSGGNYWSDYTGTDKYSGTYQNETGDDGLGDTPYVIDENNQDNYPLMKPWGLVSATVDISPNTLNLKSKGRWITAFIELPEDFNIESINASTILLNNEIPAVRVRESMVKFNRANVIEYILNSVDTAGKFTNVMLTVTGRLNDGTSFEGRDEIQITP